MDETTSSNNAPPVHDNSLYRRLIIRPLAKSLAPALHRLGFSGNGVCWLKLGFGLMGALLLASTSALVGFAGMLFLQLNFLLDAADGEVARLRGEAGRLSGEYFDKLCDHLPKTAMYFFWGYGTMHLTGSVLPLFCGAFFAAWNIYPRFCAVETLLERLDKAPFVYDNPAFQKATANSFSVKKERGRADYFLTMLVHPALNLLTLFFLIEIFIPSITLGGDAIPTRYILISAYTIVGIVNFMRKGVRFFRLLDFS